MKKHNTATKLLGILATFGFSLVGLASVSAWGPQRATFTMENPATYPTFNSITNNPTIGDERDFVRVGEINADVTNLKDEIEVFPGRQYLVYIYFHNNASATFNDSAHNNSGVALQTRMSSSFSTVLTPEERGKITGTITASNTNPTAVWDEAYMTTSTDKVLMHYVDGSAKIYNDWKTNGSVMPSSLFTEQGTYLGLNVLNGVIPGCEEYHGVVSYVLQAEELGGAIDKTVSKDGSNFGESVELAPGEEATYQLAITNTGDVALTNVFVKDELPEGLTLVPDSVQLWANESTNPESISDDIFSNGYNLGTLGTGNTIYISYRVRADVEADCEGIELTNHATLVYDSDEPSGETRDDSTTITVKKTDCTPPPADLDNCETNPGLPECQIPDELPSTGPVEIAIATLIIGGIGGAGYYLYSTKRTLRNVQNQVTGNTSSDRGFHAGTIHQGSNENHETHESNKN